MEMDRRKVKLYDNSPFCAGHWPRRVSTRPAPAVHPTLTFARAHRVTTHSACGTPLRVTSAGTFAPCVASDAASPPAHLCARIAAVALAQSLAIRQPPPAGRIASSLAVDGRRLLSKRAGNTRGRCTGRSLAPRAAQYAPPACSTPSRVTRRPWARVLPYSSSDLSRTMSSSISLLGSLPNSDATRCPNTPAGGL